MNVFVIPWVSTVDLIYHPEYSFVFTDASLPQPISSLATYYILLLSIFPERNTVSDAQRTQPVRDSCPFSLQQCLSLTSETKYSSLSSFQPLFQQQCGYGTQSYRKCSKVARGEILLYSWYQIERKNKTKQNPPSLLCGCLPVHTGHLEFCIPPESSRD